MTMLRHAARLLAKGVGLAAGTFALLSAVVFLVPEGNDYGLATVMKHERLARDVPRKIVFIGGSNLAFGMDSGMVEKQTGLPVVNMGMNGYFGVRFMLEEAKPKLKAGDIAVLSFEYDNFYKSVDGTSSDLLIVVKSRPKSFEFLTWGQRLGLVETMPFVAQQKVLRLVREGGRRIRDAVGGGGGHEPYIESIETLAGFEEHGDLRSHWGVEWKKEREPGIDITKTPRDNEVVGLLQAFATEMKARGVTVVVSYTPLLRSFYELHKGGLEALHGTLVAAPPLLVPSPPSEFVFDERLFFDTVYHLTKEGTPLRARKVARDLERVLKNGHAPAEARRSETPP